MMEPTEQKELNEQKPTLSGADPKDLAVAIAEALDMKKAKDVRILHVASNLTVADYFVLCTGRSTTQVKSLGDDVEYEIAKRDVLPYHAEGKDNGAWVAVDYSSVIVHIFSREARDFYRMDELYRDCEEIPFAKTED